MTATTTPPTVPGYVNVIVKALLRSPFHRIMSKRTMLLTFTGRKTGNRYTAVVRYFPEGDTLTCYTDSKWWKNLRGGAPVEMLIAGRTVTGLATPITDRTAVAASLGAFLTEMPGDSKYYGVRNRDDGLPDPDDIIAAAHYTTMVRIQLTN
ncbi:hypothetical protein GPX89_07120 [Nocardia sp. ET3-3]|uniref:Deazaflavin-dependent oxidoreductase (Nitroreductase family) n=1 Tax=Nocardia terrae TaxID=2675851 RepID=A0A7K1URS1_9NOCA|nr:hypothetical protein [Nocardia terrae]MVU77017.1 hypothetical protein [Nocardia terrae]